MSYNLHLKNYQKNTIDLTYEYITTKNKFAEKFRLGYKTDLAVEDDIEIRP